MSAVKKQFMFIHIPKTAGTTFVLTLARHFKWKKKLPLYFHMPDKDQPKYKPEYINRFDLAYGHVALDTALKIERGIEYFTFLRNPHDRLLSGYRHVKGDGEHGLKKRINVADYSLKDFLKSGLSKKADNLMVRYLSGNLTKDYLTVNEEDLQLAIKNFDAHFSIFGITEHFNESLVLLSDHMQWPPLYYVRENNSSYKVDPKELDEETEQLISRCTKYDEILYKHALNRFLKMMEDKCAKLNEGLIKLKEGNEKRKTILSLRNRASLFYSYIRRKLF